MINSYLDITIYDGFDFEDYLRTRCLYDIFKPVFDRYLPGQGIDFCIKVVKYIVYANSLESPKIHIGGDRRRQLTAIFKELDIPENEGGDKPVFDFFEEIVLLRDEGVIQAILNWLSHKDSRQLEYLLTLQNAYVQQQEASLRTLRKSSGEVDYDQKYKCIEYMEALRKKIKDAESELQQTDPKMKAVYEEVKAAKKGAPTLSPEQYATS